MSRNSWLFSACSVIFCLLLILVLLPADSQDLPRVKPKASYSDPELPDFAVYQSVKEKKTAFFNFVLQFVREENRRIAKLREALLRLQQNSEQLTQKERIWLKSLAEYYRVKVEAKAMTRVIAELTLRVDQIPPSLALAQAANESAWGTSRFAIEGNNLFGQWCFSKGCGLIPDGRISGAMHEVASFDSPKQSVESYIRNINAGRAYKDLRSIRAQLRQEQQPISGYELAAGLMSYSERGEDYIKEVRRMMRINKLSRFDIAEELPPQGEMESALVYSAGH
ncbi:glucosaminidase domain-containing protein [Oceanicoccus sp. KOV_DT_Chl]|uniref:glucosaminidase domain-containing protein n=1 Tax=Oceanicoccus sp. KOV_DT_Chl TaxID=1904639 RepID=UPI000C7B3A74|nr:glucosaminidase domain-containing protein [Oceanicoccus sp. KOV_DT_Chl]